jgi:class 3 adenylate cyclase
MESKSAVLVLVDISGYTQFLKFHTVSMIHAEEIISQLLEAVIDRSEHPLHLNKLEGDAAFMYALLDGDAEAVAQAVIKQVFAFFESFNVRANELACSATTCVCQACRTVKDLKLKAVLHSGEVAFRQIRQFEELGGENAIIPHRLLKNSVPAHEYILITEEAHNLVGELQGMRTEWRTESYADLGQIKVKVYYPESEALDPITPTLWQQERIRMRGNGRAIRYALGAKPPEFENLPRERVSFMAYWVENLVSMKRRLTGG